jgi:hypothetical protein
MHLNSIPNNPFQKSGLYQYKMHGGMADIDPEVFVQVYMDWEYRKAWDHYVLGKLLAWISLLSQKVYHLLKSLQCMQVLIARILKIANVEFVLSMEALECKTV